ncbi:DUF1648 domain-containing protein [Clostridium formicaceticum]|uniref:DUF5808 domain-containing protein n=1 Tax=Clostridium formicaceticum TaxID=1497 RepID=A0AAC9RJA3_9CLOT|nr:DUF5808 domain-containing protein [Clostridium formicaceticum]AOY75964.1 hypothetical protein BJL90_08670 [Clostridium formicaceticum]ARE86313.1 hypothetical protein CLFO_06350 [Clostridium formicaceticum]
MFLFIFLLNFFTVYLPLFLMGLFMPNYSKNTLVFGVNIPEEVAKDEKVIRLKQEYRIIHSVSFAISKLVIIYFAFKYESTRLLNMGILIFILLFSVNYIYIHLKTKKLKEKEGWLMKKKQVVMVSTSRNKTQKLLSMKWYLIPVFIFAFTWIFTMIMYPQLPNEIPSKLNFNGDIVKYSSKSFLSVFGMPLTQLGMLVMFYYLSKAIGRSKITINPSKPKTSEQQNIVSNKRWIGFMIFTSTIINIHFSYLQLTLLQIIKVTSVTYYLMNILVVFAPLAALVIIAVTTGQSGSKISVNLEEEVNEKLIYRDDDKYWLLGSLYYNPQDPSLWIEKRYGIGWTINIGNPIGKLLGGATIVLLVIAVIATVFL